MIYVTYNELAVRFGDPAAYNFMRTLERLASLQDNIVIPIDRERRLRRALEALNAINFDEPINPFVKAVP